MTRQWDTAFPQRDRISAPYTNKIDNPEFWRLRAEEVRTIADNMKLVEAKAILTGIAEQYEGIAKLIDQLRERKPKPTDVFEALGAERPLSRSV